jgi:ATP-dependent Clp protease ATP-binding subunit ClpA
MEDPDGMASPLIAKELQASFREAITDAKSRRHDYLTLEHLLLALTREPKTQAILVGCGVDVKRLRQRLEKFLDETVERLPDGVSADPQQTIGIERVLQRAAIHALSADQKVIDGGDVLVAMFREDESHALVFLQQEGMTRLDLLNYLSTDIPKQTVPFLVQGEVSRDIWNALVRYRGEREVELAREVSMSEALNALLAKALGLGPPPK